MYRLPLLGLLLMSVTLALTGEVTEDKELNKALQKATQLEGCGGVIRDVPDGIIEYPGDGKRYPNNAKCIWKIFVAEGARMEVSFQQFATSNRDTLLVKNGEHGSIIGSFYGRNSLPPLFKTTGNELYMYFSSDAKFRNEGFKLTWTKYINTDPRNQCVSEGEDNSILWHKVDSSNTIITSSMDIKMHNLEQELQSTKNSLINVNSTLAMKLQTMEQNLDYNSKLDNIIQLLASSGDPDVPVCSGLFTPVGDSCLLLALSERLTWVAARQYCQGLGADLAVFKDANQYANILDHIREVNSEDTNVNVWIGGSDEAVESHWVWVTGGLMPRGSPFWGTTNDYRVQPVDGDRSQNCAGLHQPDRYYVHDYPCAGQYANAPLCQKIPA